MKKRSTDYKTFKFDVWKDCEIVGEITYTTKEIVALIKNGFAKNPHFMLYDNRYGIMLEANVFEPVSLFPATDDFKDINTFYSLIFHLEGNACLFSVLTENKESEWIDAMAESKRRELIKITDPIAHDAMYEDDNINEPHDKKTEKRKNGKTEKSNRVIV